MTSPEITGIKACRQSESYVLVPAAGSRAGPVQVGLGHCCHSDVKSVLDKGKCIQKKGTTIFINPYMEMELRQEWFYD